MSTTRPGTTDQLHRRISIAVDVRDAAARQVGTFLAEAFPLGSRVTVRHHRGSFTGVVVGYRADAAAVEVRNDRSGKVRQWNYPYVERAEP